MSQKLFCCGDERQGKYCQECGSKLGAHPLASLLAYVECHAKGIKGNIETAKVKEPQRVVLLERSLRKWTSWADAVRAAIKPTPGLTTIKQLRLSVRARKTLMRLGIETIDQLTATDTASLVEIKNCGMHTINEIKSKLAEHGLRLNDPNPPTE